uniref:Uncharacterized protein n=1 Tax=Glossina pallidipes TaxID=7398 RepID=A0A1A9Z616_GLOPL
MTIAIDCCKTQTQQEMYAYNMTSINRNSYKKANDRTQCMQPTLRSSPRDTLANPYCMSPRHRRGRRKQKNAEKVVKSTKEIEISRIVAMAPIAERIKREVQ